MVIVETAVLETVTFISAQLYGEDGHLLDSVIWPWPDGTDASIAVQAVRELAGTHGFDTLELWTANTAIYAACLAVPGVGAAIKHPSDTASAIRAVEDNRQILTDLYGIKPIVEPAEEPIKRPPLPRWRAVLAGYVRTVLKLIEGDGKYEI